MTANKDATDPLTKLNKALKKFLREFGEPEPFYLAEEIMKAHNSNVPFYAKYMKIKGLNSAQIGNLIRMVIGDDIEDDSTYLAYVFSSNKGENRTTVVTPGAIYSVNADFEAVRDAVFNDQWNVLDELEVAFPHRHHRTETYFDSGHTALFSDVLSDDEALNAIAKEEWKKITIDVRTEADRRFVPGEFKNKIIKDKINALYRGNGKKNIIHIPPEEFSIHLGKLLRFYFDKTLDKIKISGDAIDISDLQLPGLKRKKIKVKEKIAKEMKVYKDLAEIGTEKEMQTIKRIPYNTKNWGSLSWMLLGLALKEKDSNISISDVWIGGMLQSDMFIQVGKNVIIRQPGSLIKISDDQAEELVDELRLAIRESIEKLENSAYGKFKLRPSQISHVFESLRDGIIITTKESVFFNTKEWKEHKITVPVSDENKVVTSVKTKGRIIWADKRAVKKVVNAAIREKITKWKKSAL